MVHYVTKATNTQKKVNEFKFINKISLIETKSKDVLAPSYSIKGPTDLSKQEGERGTPEQWFILVQSILLPRYTPGPALQVKYEAKTKIYLLNENKSILAYTVIHRDQSQVSALEHTLDYTVFLQT